MEEVKPVRKTSPLAWMLVFLGAAATVVEILSISTLGTNANRAFDYVGKDSPRQERPAPAVPHPPVAGSPFSNR